MNMKRPVCHEMVREHTMRTEWHHYDLRDAQHLDEAWSWLCASRKTAPVNADIWDLRHRWPAYRETFLRQLQSGAYRLSPMQVVGARRQVMWSAEDALALKWVALSITPSIPVHEKCEHVKGHGGGRSSVRRISQSLTENGYRWVCRTDIKGYYGAINKETLLTQLRQHITRPAYLTLLTQYIHYSVEEGGEFYTPAKGIARGCALSPLIGALHLWAVDNYFAHQHKIYYGRYMDDFVILTRSRWQLRKQVTQLNKYLASLGFEKHPDKTFIGKVSKGFDWLGAWLTDKGTVGIAPHAQANNDEKIRRLYEQTRHWSKTKQARRVSDYRNRWKIWTMSIFVLGVECHAAAYTVEIGGTVLIPVSATSVASPVVNPTTVDTNSGFPRLAQISGKPNIAWLYTKFSTTSDGYFGFTLAPDVVVGITGQMNGSAYIYPSNTLDSYSCTWDSYGLTSCPRINPSFPWGIGTDPSTAQVLGRSWELPTTFNGTVFIHAGPNAARGTYTTTEMNLSRYLAFVNQPLQLQTILPVSTVSVVPPTSCTVGVDRTGIDFGNAVQLTSNNITLSNQTTALSVTCSTIADGGGTVPMTLSINGTPGRYTNSLGLVGADTQTSIAEIRGYLSGAPAVGQPCGPSLNVRGQPTSLGSFKVGVATVPITWGLCSNGSGMVGAGSATATLSVNWP